MQRRMWVTVYSLHSYVPSRPYAHDKVAVTKRNSSAPASCLSNHIHVTDKKILTKHAMPIYIHIILNKLNIFIHHLLIEIEIANLILIPSLVHHWISWFLLGLMSSRWLLFVQNARLKYFVFFRMLQSLSFHECTRAWLL